MFAVRVQSVRLAAQLVLALLLLASAATGGEKAAQQLWSNGRDAIVVTHCSSRPDQDDFCRAVVVRSSRHTTIVGEGYIRVQLLWSKSGHQKGPDAIILAEQGGSGGEADLLALSFNPGLELKKLGGERMDEVNVVPTTSGGLQIAAPLDLEFFNGAPYAGAITVLLPFRWAHNDFSVDLGRLASWSFSPQGLDFRQGH